MKKNIKKKLATSTIISYFLYALINIYLFTIRIRYESEDEFLNHLSNGGSAVIAVSHQHFFVCIKALKKYLKYNIAGIVSKSRDGDVFTTIGELNGYIGIRGSSSRGGKEAMELMIKFLTNSNTIGAVAPDGPKGPLGIVKPGSIRIAQKSGAVIFPCSAIANSAWHVSSWDNSMIPKPFSKVTIKFSEKILADSIENSDAFENKRIELQNSLAKYIIK
ncbi:MAG: lysophospholipid acyltransferase family protein [Desulfobacteraceae bacterium]|nr:lysophospholipid acyltransferase family protein [Desulfobacteraceae bacterium]